MRIVGVLTRAHVQKAETAIIQKGGTGIHGVEIGTLVESIGEVGDATV